MSLEVSGTNMAGQARGFGDGMEKDEGELKHDGCLKDYDEEDLNSKWDLAWLAGLDEDEDEAEVEVEAVRILVPRSALVRERKANKRGIAMAGGVGGRLCRKELGDVEEDGEEEIEEEERARLVSEKDAAVRELAVQLQLNRELKALLVASLGSDVQRKVEALVKEHLMQAALSREASHKLSAVTERAERLHIQCDVWRSKSIGSRLLAEEQASARRVSECAEKNARRAVHALLAEHRQLRRDLADTYRILDNLQSALQGLTSPMSTPDPHVPLPVPNTLELSEQVRDRARAISDHLLGGKDSRSWPLIELSATVGEHLGIKVLVPKTTENAGSTGMAAASVLQSQGMQFCGGLKN
uniref:golgin-45 isoform X3 n=1 Tax=Myxine glutinosa TaxID=7769 RepID=UPI00358FB84C